MSSNFTAVNPKYIGGNSPIGNVLRVDRLATDSKTWKAGEFGYLDGSGNVQPVSSATGGTAVVVQFCEDQDTSTSTSTVKVQELQRGARFEIYVTNNGTAAAIGVANMSLRYGIYTASNVSYLDVNVTSGADFKVVDLLARAESLRNLTADTPGKCVVEFDPLT